MKVLCPAKINLFLNVIGKNEDGSRHNLVLINQTVDLYDVIDIEVIDDKKIIIESDDDIPKDEHNSAYKACMLMIDTYDIKCGFNIKIEKHIPIMAGLGGESTDAAGVLLGINKLLSLHIPKQELSKLGNKIGSDVPYFVHSGYKKVLESGNVVKRMSNSNRYNSYIVIKPDFGLSTAEMFKKIDEYDQREIDISLPHNDFMKVVPKEIIKIKKQLDKLNICNHTLSGSGSSYYIALSQGDNELYEKIRKLFSCYQIFMVSNCNGYIIKK